MKRQHSEPICIIYNTVYWYVFVYVCGCMCIWMQCIYTNGSLCRSHQMPLEMGWMWKANSCSILHCQRAISGMNECFGATKFESLRSISMVYLAFTLHIHNWYGVSARHIYVFMHNCIYINDCRPLTKDLQLTSNHQKLLWHFITWDLLARANGFEWIFHILYTLFGVGVVFFFYSLHIWQIYKLHVVVLSLANST